MHSHQPPGPRGPYAQQPSDGSWQPQPNGPYQHAPGGPYQQPQPPRRKRHLGLKITLGIVGGVIALIIIGAIASALGGGNSGTSTGTGTSTSSGTSSVAAPAPGIGDKVRDGKFEFVITKVTHAKSVGDTSLGLGDTAQGRYVILHIRVTNIGTEAQTLDDSSQYVYDAAGRKFSASTSADIDLSGANGQNNTWFEDINPGNSVHGRIAFDLPAGDNAVKAELHDSAFSDGVTVKLH
jgi:Domain of unknown function (DUF4352)